jgi:hypothetical protein
MDHAEGFYFGSSLISKRVMVRTDLQSYGGNSLCIVCLSPVVTNEEQSECTRLDLSESCTPDSIITTDSSFQEKNRTIRRDPDGSDFGEIRKPDPYGFAFGETKSSTETNKPDPDGFVFRETKSSTETEKPDPDGFVFQDHSSSTVEATTKSQRGGSNISRQFNIFVSSSALLLLLVLVNLSGDVLAEPQPDHTELAKAQDWSIFQYELTSAEIATHESQ